MCFIQAAVLKTLFESISLFSYVLVPFMCFGSYIIFLKFSKICISLTWCPSGFNSTLRQGNVTHHEYIQVLSMFLKVEAYFGFWVIKCEQVGKGRDVGLNQIALFEGKVAGGNGEQVLSRDVYRLGQLFDFFRMMSFYVTTVGFYFCTMVCPILLWNSELSYYSLIYV